MAQADKPSNTGADTRSGDLDGSISVAELVQKFNICLDQKSALCDTLERIADGLPDKVDSHECLQVAQSLIPLVKRAHDYEESRLFPVLMLNMQDSQNLVATLDRLRFEHLGDEDFAEELRFVLHQFVTDREHANVELIGWMLRGFFESIRRHVAFEREHVLPLLEQITARQS